MRCQNCGKKIVLYKNNKPGHKDGSLFCNLYDERGFFEFKLAKRDKFSIYLTEVIKDITPLERFKNAIRAILPIKSPI